MASYYKGLDERESSHTEVLSLFMQLRKVVEKKAASFWHIESFKRYMRENVNPFGLRIQIFPILEDIDMAFKQKWEDNLQNCTMTMMRLLIEEYEKRIIVMDKDIDLIYKKLQPFNKLATFRKQE